MSLIILYTILTVLNLLGVESVLVRLQNMLSEIGRNIKNFGAAGLITFAGYILGSEATGILNSLLLSILKIIAAFYKLFSLWLENT
jgi:hypothetical protein